MTLSPNLVAEVLRQLLPEGYLVVTKAEIAKAKGDDLLTREEVAQELNVAPGTLKHWGTTGEGPPFVKVPGFRAPRYRRSDLEAWKASLKAHTSHASLRHAS